MAHAKASGQLEQKADEKRGGGKNHARWMMYAAQEFLYKDVSVNVMLSHNLLSYSYYTEHNSHAVINLHFIGTNMVLHISFFKMFQVPIHAPTIINHTVSKPSHKMSQRKP